jgi:hypothetical protein
MKQLILLIMLIALLLLVSEIEQSTIQLVIVIPLEWVPYVDWWLSFPGFQQPDQKLPSQQNIGFIIKAPVRESKLLPIC